jgi:hypothetical protein
MPKRNMATGIFTWATCKEFKNCVAAGKAAPRPIPTKIHRATHFNPIIIGLLLSLFG